MEIFTPFFSLIRSPLSTGPITATALSAVHTFFVSGFVTPAAPGLESFLSELSNTVSHCKFEASDASGDEVVLLRIMAVIKECLCCAAGDHLGDVEVCEMLETVLTTCCQMRLSGAPSIWSSDLPFFNVLCRNSATELRSYHAQSCPSNIP